MNRVLWAALALIFLAATLPLTPGWAGSKDKIDQGAKQPDVDVVIDGQLTNDDPKDAKRKLSPSKSHPVELYQGVTYVIDLVSKDFDAFLRLADAGGTELAEDDDGGGGTNARLFFIPAKTDTYTIIATAFAPKTGKYRLTVQEAHLQPQTLALDDGAAKVKDQLTPASGRSPFSPHNVSKLYRVELKADTTYVIDLESSAFDAYLTLADSRLRLLAADDDSGGKRNARIRYECKEDGTYYIVATGLGHPEGEFELKVHPAK